MARFALAFLFMCAAAATAAGELRLGTTAHASYESERRLRVELNVQNRGGVTLLNLRPVLFANGETWRFAPRAQLNPGESYQEELVADSQPLRGRYHFPLELVYTAPDGHLLSAPAVVEVNTERMAAPARIELGAQPLVIRGAEARTSVRLRNRGATPLRVRLAVWTARELSAHALPDAVMLAPHRTVLLPLTLRAAENAHGVHAVHIIAFYEHDGRHGSVVITSRATVDRRSAAARFYANTRGVGLAIAALAVALAALTAHAWRRSGRA